MITSETRWTPLPGPLASAWEGSDTGLVRRTAAPAGYEGFVGRLALPGCAGKRIQFMVRPLGKGLTRAVSLREVLGLHGIAEVPGLDWLEQARDFVADYNARLEADEEVERGDTADLREVQACLGSAGDIPGGVESAGHEPGLSEVRLDADRVPDDLATAAQAQPACREAAVLVDAPLHASKPLKYPCGRSPWIVGCHVRRVHAGMYGWPLPCTKCERPGVLHA